MKRLMTRMPIIALILGTIISIAASYYVTVYTGEAPVLLNEELR